MNKLAWSLVLSIAVLAGTRSHSQELPPIAVDLPPQPSWAPSTIPEKYPDGKWSVRGLRKKIKSTLSQEVEVKAVLLSVYECPPEQAKCPKGKTCKPCDVPHFYIADTKETRPEKAMVVCNYPVKPKPPVLPPVGTELVIKGTFTQEAGGFAASGGLIDHTQTATADGKVVVSGNALVTKEEATMQEATKGGKLPKKR